MTMRALLFLLLVPGVAAGQVADPGSTSTHLVRAAGMPLADGTLPPGMLTVRVVRGSFSGDLVGQVVEMEVAGGKVESAVTGDDGRAQFAHLPVGGDIRVSATVDGAPLASESFQMPADSGVRVLLVAGGAGDALPAGAHPNVTQSPPTVVAASGSTANAGGEDPVVTAIRTVLATSTVFALGVVVLRRRRPHLVR